MSANPRQTVTGYSAPPQPSATVNNGHPYATNQYYNPYAVPVPGPGPGPGPGPAFPRSAFLRSFIVALLVLFLITGTVMLIFRIVFRLRVPAFYVTSLSLSNYSVSASASTSVTATWLLTLRAVNPNKKIRISYDEIVSSIAYRDESLATASVPPFYQGTRDTTDLRVGFTDKDYYVSPGTANGMKSDRTGGGSVAFDFRVRAVASLKAKGCWWTRTRIIRVICLGIPVKFMGNATVGSGSSGQLNGGNRECGVLF